MSAYVVKVTSADATTSRQRWSHYFAVLFALGGLIIGINLRDAALNATTLYVNTEAGIRAEYPSGWLIDSVGDYVFRVRDMSQSGFKTTIQVATQPVSASATTRNIVDSLSLSRSQVLSSYTVYSIQPFTLPGQEEEALAVRYTYVAAEANPFLQSIPFVVEGIDILTIRRGQVIVITFNADSREYGQQSAIFNRFLESLEI